ncbi:NADPH2:quinone reductase [Tirmania nivea]|nr:NADPH2:quinone reductase [Tirmania nivea]
MKAIQVTEYVRSLDDLRVTPNLPRPTPKPSEYLVRIQACATNFFDILQVQGLYQHQPAFPWVSGSEFSGTVVAAPADRSDTRFQPGDRVFGAAQGAYAEHICCAGTSLHRVPAGWAFDEAAGLYITAPTSYGALVTRAGLQPGEWALVHAGAGGVGLAAVQIAKACGAVVVATAGSARKLAVARSFGADYALDYRADSGWQNTLVEILKANNHPGVDVVFDPVGLVSVSLKVAAWNARLLVVGFAGGAIEKVALNRVLLKNVSIVGIHWGMYARFEPETVDEVWKGLFVLIEQGRFRPTVYRDREYIGLESVGPALKALAGRETWGKVVIKVPGEDDSAKL